MKRFFHNTLAIIVTFVSGVFIFSSTLMADNLKVALAAEPTSMDPHYQNLTINNSFATQVFNALVLQDVNQNLIPGLAISWNPVDENTWEFKKFFCLIKALLSMILMVI